MSLIRRRLFVLVPTSVILWTISLVSVVIICIGSGLRSGLKARCMKRYVSSLISLRTCPKKPCLIGSLLMLLSMLSFENRSPLPEDTGSSLLWTGYSKVQCGQDIRPVKTRWSLISTTPERRTNSQSLLSRPFGNFIKRRCLDGDHRGSVGEAAGNGAEGALRRSGLRRRGVSPSPRAATGCLATRLLALG